MQGYSIEEEVEYDNFEVEEVFADYQELSKTYAGGRAYGEAVTLMGDGEILAEHQGHLIPLDF
jgi:hypothetical protein